MPKVNISKAAMLAGITRQHLYKKYINTGFITVEQGRNGAKQIDTTEILRVFGELSGDTVDSKQVTQNLQNMTLENDSQVTALQAEVRVLREQLNSASEREKWLQGKVDQLGEQLSITTRMLEHKQVEPKPAADAVPTKKKWWSFK